MKKALFWVLAFVLLAGLVPDTVVPVKAEDYGVISFPGAQYENEGMIGVGNTSDMYEITLDVPGRLALNISAPVLDGTTRLNARLLASDGTLIDYFIDGAYYPLLPRSNTFDLLQGTYYVAISQYQSNTGVYYLSVSSGTTYTVTYDANNGSGAPSPQTKAPGETLTLSGTAPQRNGFTFQGWATSSSATTAQYQPGGSYTPDENVTLYAVWQETGTQPSGGPYTVAYNANSGTGAPANQTKTHGTPLTLSNTSPTRSGFNFQGWATSSSATTPQYQPGGSYTPDENVTLYAVWASSNVPTYTVRYNANGGSGEPGPQTKTHDVPLTLSSMVPGRHNHDFKGWATSAATRTVQYQPGDSFTENANRTLYAVWERDPDAPINVAYHANGGRNAPAPQIKTPGEALRLSNGRPVHDDGYDFRGWGTSSGATTPEYMPGDSYNIDDDIVLYAIWLSDDIPPGSGRPPSVISDEYEIYYHANGGSGAPAPQYKSHGAALSLSGSRPARSGYTFVGWSANPSASSAQYQPGSRYTADSDITLYAVWASDLPRTGRVLWPIPLLAVCGAAFFAVGYILRRKNKA
ncbi:MAG: InlB B-repeat-containing protein [Oscillospiraceae bacterium]|nr:InlB B-repeat-containing protein [Oscillospiraceae bacterium]